MRTLFTLMICLACFSTYADIQRYGYFADLPFWESPIQLFQGQNPISQQRAKSLVHVQVGYDKFNRIIDIQTKQGNKFKPFYRGFGSLYLYAPHTKIHYTNNQVIVSFYNQFGNQIKVLGNVWKVHYQLDERNRFTQMRFIDQNGEYVENRYGYATYYWQHQLDGSIIEHRENLKGEALSHRPGFQFKRIKLTFDQNGYLSLMQNIDENGKLIAAKSGAAQYKYFYNRDGGFDRWEVYDENGEPALGPTGTAGEQYSFNDKGWTQIAFFNKSGEPDYHASGAVNWHASYDQFGNMTARWFTDAEGLNIMGKFGFHKVKYVYDEQGLYQIRQEFYDDENRLVKNLDGVALVHFSLNKHGQVVTQKHTDERGNLVMDAWRKFSVAKFKYTKEGQEKQVEKFDELGNKIESD